MSYNTIIIVTHGNKLNCASHSRKKMFLADRNIIVNLKNGNKSSRGKVCTIVT